MLSRIFNGIKARASGHLSLSIKRLKFALNEIDKIDSPFEDKRFWLSWYSYLLEASLKRTKILRFLMASLGGNTLFKRLGIDEETIYTIAYRKILANPSVCKNGKVTLGEIQLPVANENEYAFHAMVIAECCTGYLMENVFPIETINTFFEGTGGTYEFGEAKLKTGDIVIDAGSCEGIFAALASVKGCTTYAFEPIPDTIERYLSYTVQWNKNINICEYALSDEDGEIDFNISQVSGYASAYMEPFLSSKIIRVRTISLDDFVSRNNIPRVDFIKADIEGAERFMLKGAINTLREFGPKLAICTYHLSDDPKTLRQLVLNANSNYVIEEKFNRLFAHIPKINKR